MYKYSKRKERKERKRKNRIKKKSKKKKLLEKCSPKKEGEVLEYTCYTEEALHKLKNIWNARHADMKIETNETKEIWKKLKKYLSSSCDKESCWLKHKCLKEGISRNIINNTFAPLQPIEWSKNPYEWLSSVDIQKVMKQYENAFKNFTFIGPSPIDFDFKKLYGECVWNELCNFNLINEIKRGKNKIGIIFNLDPHTKSGSHWVAMFINAKKREIIYMDSYGDKPPKEINTLANRIQEQSKLVGKPYDYNKIE